MRIIFDQREQLPFSFARFDDCEVQRGLLYVGDYSLPGFEGRAAIERKSLDDLVGSITAGRERFMRELQRGRALDLFAVVCEGSWLDLQTGRYRSRMNPAAAFQTVLSICARGVPVIMAGDRNRAEAITYGILRHFLRHRQNELRAAFPEMFPAKQKEDCNG